MPRIGWRKTSRRRSVPETAEPAAQWRNPVRGNTRQRAGEMRKSAEHARGDRAAARFVSRKCRAIEKQDAEATRKYIVRSMPSKRTPPPPGCAGPDAPPGRNRRDRGQAFTRNQRPRAGDAGRQHVSRRRERRRSIAFLERAFGFTRASYCPAPMAAALRGDAAWRRCCHADSESDGTSATGGAAALYTYVGDVDKALTKARAAGAGVSEAEDRPWGDRTATVTDPMVTNGCSRRSRSSFHFHDRLVTGLVHRTIFSAQKSVRTRAHAACATARCVTGSCRPSRRSRPYRQARRRMEKPRDAVLDHLRKPSNTRRNHRTSQAIASSAARPKLSCADGSRNRSAMDKSGTTSSCAPSAWTSGEMPSSRLIDRRFRAPAVTHEQQPRRDLLTNPIEDPITSRCASPA